MDGRTSSRRHRMVFASGVSTARDARTFVTSTMAQEPAARAMEAARLIVSELVSNAVQHGGPADEIIVELDLSSSLWVGIEVIGGRDELQSVASPSEWSVASPDQPTGRGLGIVRSLAEEVGLATRDGFVVVRCRVRR